GENKVQELARKAQEMEDLNVQWSAIGHLQTNKAREVARFAHEFQALDNLRQAEALERRLQHLGRSLNVFVQVNTSAEPQKYGLAPDEVEDFRRNLAPYETLKVQGLMTLALFTEDTERVRECFVTLRTVRDQVQASSPDLIGAGELS